MKGRKPIPTTIKILQGNRGKRPLPVGEPKPQRGVPDRPPFLKGAGREEWDRIVPILNGTGILTLADMAAVSGYCEAWNRFVLAAKSGEKVGNELAILLKFIAVLGLSPADRPRIKVPGADAPKDALAEFIA